MSREERQAENLARWVDENDSGSRSLPAAAVPDELDRLAARYDRVSPGA